MTLSSHFAATRVDNVAAENLHSAQERCPVCDDDSPRQSVEKVQEDPEVSYLRCGRCFAASTSMMPSTEFLEDCYRTFYSSQEQGVAFQGIPRFVRHLRRLLRGQRFGERLRILDFGGGDGSLSIALAESLVGTSVEVTVVDFSAPPSSSRGDLDVLGFTELSLAKPPYDLVIASAILEHVPDLSGALRTLLEMMAPNGALYARTPYALPLKALLGWYPLIFPLHVHDLGPRFWANACATFDFPGTLEVSRPSIVESELRVEPLRSLAAYLAKAPAHLESRALRGRLAKREPLWPFAGGWEVILRRD